MNMLILIYCTRLLHEEALRTNKHLNMYNVSIWIKHMVQKALKISGLMCVIITNLLVYFKTSKNNFLLNGLKNEFISILYTHTHTHTHTHIYIYIYIYTICGPGSSVGYSD